MSSTNWDQGAIPQSDLQKREGEELLGRDGLVGVDELTRGTTAVDGYIQQRTTIDLLEYGYGQIEISLSKINIELDGVSQRKEEKKTLLVVADEARLLETDRSARENSDILHIGGYDNKGLFELKGLLESGGYSNIELSVDTQLEADCIKKANASELIKTLSNWQIGGVGRNIALVGQNSDAPDILAIFGDVGPEEASEQGGQGAAISNRDLGRITLGGKAEELTQTAIQLISKWKDEIIANDLEKIFGQYAEAEETHRRLNELTEGRTTPQIYWATFQDQGIFGCFDAEGEKIYINETIKSNKHLALATALEEIGHWLDGGQDALGDEGLKFAQTIESYEGIPVDVGRNPAINDHARLLIRGNTSTEVELGSYADYSQWNSLGTKEDQKIAIKKQDVLSTLLDYESYEWANSEKYELVRNSFYSENGNAIEAGDNVLINIDKNFNGWLSVEFAVKNKTNNDVSVLTRYYYVEPMRDYILDESILTKGYREGASIEDLKSDDPDIVIEKKDGKFVIGRTKATNMGSVSKFEFRVMYQGTELASRKIFLLPVAYEYGIDINIPRIRTFNEQALTGTTIITGTEGDDQESASSVYTGLHSIVGTGGNDAIFGLGGNDVIYGRSGDDIIDGGYGYDLIYGEAGGDTIEGGENFDYIFAGDGSDQVSDLGGGAVIHLGEGDDAVTLTNSTGWTNSYIYGEEGNDTFNLIDSNYEADVWGGTGSDTYNIVWNKYTHIMLHEEGDTEIDTTSINVDYEESGGVQGQPFYLYLWPGKGDINLDIDTTGGYYSNITIMGRSSSELGNSINGTIKWERGDIKDQILDWRYYNSIEGFVREVYDYAKGESKRLITKNSDERYEGYIHDLTIDINPSMYGGSQSSIELVGTRNDDQIRINAAEETLLDGYSSTSLDNAYNNYSILIDAGSGDDKIEINEDTLDIIKFKAEVYGGKGSDAIVGTRGNDIVYGEEDNDTIYTGKGGNDKIFGGSGNDHIIIEIDRNRGNRLIEIDGGLGDIVEIRDNSREYTFSRSEIVSGGEQQYVHWLVAKDYSLIIKIENPETGIKFEDSNAAISIEDLLLSQEIVVENQNMNFMEYLRQDNIVVGTEQNDILFAGAGEDNLKGLKGQDTLSGDEGDDLIQGGSGADIIFGGAGNDTIEGGLGRDKLFGMEGNDKLYAYGFKEVISGGVGDDYYSVRNDADYETYNTQLIVDESGNEVYDLNAIAGNTNYTFIDKAGNDEYNVTIKPIGMSRVGYNSSNISIYDVGGDPLADINNLNIDIDGLNWSSLSIGADNTSLWNYGADRGISRYVGTVNVTNTNAFVVNNRWSSSEQLYGYDRENAFKICAKDTETTDISLKADNESSFIDISLEDTVSNIAYIRTGDRADVVQMDIKGRRASNAYNYTSIYTGSGDDDVNISFGRRRR